VDAQLKSQLRQIVTFRPSTASVNSYGEIQVGSTATAWCRLENRMVSVQKFDGTYQRTAEPYLVLDSDVATPTFETRYWLPGHSPNSAGFARLPKGITPYPDEFGNVDHWELMF
jgi:hypothetical protein